MPDNTHLLLRTNLKQLKLPTMGAEFEKLAREAAAANEAYEQYLLRLSELEVAARSTNAVQTRIRNAGFPVLKDFDTFDFTAVPSLNKPKGLELARGEWIKQRCRRQDRKCLGPKASRFCDVTLDDVARIEVIDGHVVQLTSFANHCL